jgi:S-adenosylmethionine synthetase
VRWSTVTCISWLIILRRKRVSTIAHQAAQEHGAFNVSVAVNTADDPAAGSIYRTVTGTSAEAGDDGEAGRGNRVKMD